MGMAKLVIALSIPFYNSCCFGLVMECKETRHEAISKIKTLYHVAVTPPVLWKCMVLEILLANFH